MFKPPTVSKIAEKHIKSLEDDGIKLTVNEILLLYELGKIASHPIDDKLLDICYESFGNLKVYPITIGAKLWLQHVMDSFPFDDQLIELAVFYAYAHARSPSKFIFDSNQECKKAITSFARSLKITEYEMGMLIDRVTPQTIEGRKRAHIDDKESSLIPALCLLMNTFGKDKEYWLWQETEDTCVHMIKEAIKIKAEKYTKGKIDNNDNSILGFFALKKAVNDIRKSREVVVPAPENVDKVDNIDNVDNVDKVEEKHE